MRFSFLLLFILLIPKLSFSAVELSSLKYKKLHKPTFEYRIDIFEKKWFLKISHLELQNKELIDEVLTTEKGLLYHTEDGSAYYAEGMSVSEFKKAIIKKDAGLYYVLNLLVSPSYASDINCNTSTIDLMNPAFTKLGEGLDKLDVFSMVQKCDFSISNIFETQLDSFKELGATLFSGNFWNTISKATNDIINLLPIIKEQVMPALAGLIGYAPQLAEKLFCNFTEKKVGALILSTATGGMTAAPMIAATVNDSLKLVEKIKIITENKKLLSFVAELEKRKLLTKEMIESVSKMVPDIPDTLKNTQTNRFRAAENRKVHHEKHGKSLEANTEAEYEEKAKAFAGSKSTPHTVSFTEKNGDVIKWDTHSDEMLVLNKYGNFITYFKLNCKNEFEKLLYVILPKEQKSTVCK